MGKELYVVWFINIFNILLEEVQAALIVVLKTKCIKQTIVVIH